MVILRLGLNMSEPDGTTVEFRDSSTRSTLWNAPHPRNSEPIKLNVSVDKAVHVDGLKRHPSEVETDDDGNSPSWYPVRRCMFLNQRVPHHFTACLNV